MKIAYSLFLIVSIHTAAASQLSKGRVISKSKIKADQAKLVWLDTDPGINVGVLDDVIAILLAGFNPTLNLLGISTVAGNTDVENCTKNALNVLSFVHLNVFFIYVFSFFLLTEGVSCEWQLEAHFKNEICR